MSTKASNPALSFALPTKRPTEELLSFSFFFLSALESSGSPVSWFARPYPFDMVMRGGQRPLGIEENNEKPVPRCSVFGWAPKIKSHGGRWWFALVHLELQRGSSQVLRPNTRARKQISSRKCWCWLLAVSACAPPNQLSTEAEVSLFVLAPGPVLAELAAWWKGQSMAAMRLFAYKLPFCEGSLVRSGLENGVRSFPCVCL